MMKALLFAALPFFCLGQNTDLFNYRETDESARDFGPRDWDQVECDDREFCVSVVRQSFQKYLKLARR